MKTKFNISYKNSLLSRCTVIDQSQDQPSRFFSSPKPGFISKFLENIKQEMQKNKEMTENLKKFREEAEKLEQSDALKSARKKFQTVESEASKGSDVLKGRIEELGKKVKTKVKLIKKKN